jgi:hypothetical protein
MVDARRSLHRELRESPGFLATAIPYAAEIERMGTRRAPVPVFAPASAASLAYESLWREILAAASGYDS